MSVIIRLQSLPLSAKSGDIRHFFRGLHIPDGGVHIIGGEKGIAFIAFNSDEDARIGMRKDGWKIMDSRVKLFLSSRMEMQHEIERITKHELMIEASQRSSNRWRGSAQTRSPPRDYERNDRDRRSFSPMGKRSMHHVERMLSPRRSRSPDVRRSRSPNLGRSWLPEQRSPSIRHVTSHENNSNSYTDSFPTSEIDRNRKEFNNNDGYHKQDYFDSSRDVRIVSELQNEMPASKEQLQLEERITEALNAGFVKNAFADVPPRMGDTLGLQIPHGMMEQYPKQGPGPLFGTEFSSSCVNDVNLGNNFYPPVFPASNLIPGIAPMNQVPNMMIPPVNLVPPLHPPFSDQNMGVPPAASASTAVKSLVPFTGYYVTISGLDTMWTNRDVQALLKGIFAPQENIRWEVDDHGFKTGTAFIKLMNKDDVAQLLSRATYVFESKLITVSECPNIVYEKYFPPPSAPPLPGQNIIKDGDLYYRLTGLPFTVTYEEIMHFFYGFQIADVYLENGQNGKMTGNGYICFTNIQNYERARAMHGKKLGHRCVEMIPSSRQEMLEAKRRNGDLFNLLYTSSDSPYMPLKEKHPPLHKRPLCALLTGLPPFIKIHKIAAFFSEHGHKPDAIHLIVNHKRQPTGRAFAEFSNIRDFDAALKCHGNKIGNNMICVKQILFDEMTQILSTQKAKHDYGIQNKSNLVQIDLPNNVIHNLWDVPVPNQGNFLEAPGITPWHNSNTMNVLANNDVSLDRNNTQFFKYGDQFKAPLASSMPADFQAPYNEGNFNVQPDQKFDFLQRNDHFEEKRKEQPDQKFVFLQRNDHWEGKRKRKRPFQHKTTNHQDNDFLHNMDSGHVKPVAKQIEDDCIREPVKFEVKIKQPVAKNTKADDAFDRTAKNDALKKLSKLTPDKEVGIAKPISTKDVQKNKDLESVTKVINKSKPAPPKKNDNNGQSKGNITTSGKKDVKKGSRNDAKGKGGTNKSDLKQNDTRSVKTRERHSPRHQSRETFSPRRLAHERSPRRLLRQRSPRLRSRDNVSPEHRSRERFSPQHKFGDRSRSPFKSDYYEKTSSRYEFQDLDGPNESIIEMSNVPSVVEIQELRDFFRGFDIIEDKMIRRYSNWGEPLGDVRVSFPNRREAERAIRRLNGQYMNGAPIDMIILQ